MPTGKSRAGACRPCAGGLALLLLAGTLVAASSGGESFEALRKSYEDQLAKPAVERIPALRAIGECEDPRAGKYIADLLAAGGKETGLLEVAVQCLGARGDAAALEATLSHAFKVLPESRWRAVGDSFTGHLTPEGTDWFLERGFSAIPTLPAGAQRIVVDLLLSISDERRAEVASKLLGNRKCPSAIQADFVELLRIHKAKESTKKIAAMHRFDDAKLQVAVLRALRDFAAAEHSKIFLESLESRHWEVRSIAVDILGDTHDPAMVPQIVPLLADPFPEVQVSAIQALRKIGGRDVVPPLIAALEKAPGRVRDDIADTLLWLLGEDMGPDAIAWSTWWKLHGDTAEVKGITREEFDRLREASANSQTGTYYGLRVISEYVTFVIDVSGSMEEPYLVEERSGKEDEGEGRGGTSVAPSPEEKKKKKAKKVERRKIEVAREELGRALRGLRDGVQFNLIPFDSRVQRYRDCLTEMSEEVRADALDFVASLKPGGMTNVYDSLMTALEDPKVNTVYFLSDGAPTNGKVVDPAEILRHVREANEIRKVKIHTIGFHLAPEAEDLMRKLAEENYGTFVKR